MEVLEFDEEFDPTRCPVCGADGYVDDEGIVRCSSCFAELPGDGLDWDSELVWADDEALGPMSDATVDPEDFLTTGQRGPLITERSRRREALAHRAESLVDLEPLDADGRGLDDVVDDGDDMVPDYASHEFVDPEVALDEGPDRGSDGDLYL